MTTALSPRSRIGSVLVSAIVLSGLSGCADPVNPEATLISVGDGVEIGIFGGRCAQIDDVATSFRSQPGGRDIFEVQIGGEWNDGNDCALGVIEPFEESFTPSAIVSVRGLLTIDFELCEGTTDIVSGTRLCEVE